MRAVHLRARRAVVGIPRAPVEADVADCKVVAEVVGEPLARGDVLRPPAALAVRVAVERSRAGPEVVERSVALQVVAGVARARRL